MTQIVFSSKIIFLAMYILLQQLTATPVQVDLQHPQIMADNDISDTQDNNPEAEDKAKDPLEPLNRVIFEVNQFFDKLILAPAAYAFQDLLSEDTQTAVKNFFSNLGEPITLVNDMLQANPDLACQSLARFILNSTLGCAGLYDYAATQAKIQPHIQDFGITLAKWGVDADLYLVLPILGPSTVRDAIGKVGDYFGDPYNIVMKRNHKKGLIYVRSAANGVIKRQGALALTEDMDQDDDSYSQYRSVFYQNRDDVIKNSIEQGSDYTNNLE